MASFPVRGQMVSDEIGLQGLGRGFEAGSRQLEGDCGFLRVAKRSSGAQIPKSKSDGSWMQGFTAWQR